MKSMKFIRFAGSLLFPLAFASVALTASATTPAPTISSVVGDTSNFINLAGSTTVAISGTLTGSSTASTTITATFTDASSTSISGYLFFGNTNSYSFNLNESSLVDGSVSVSVIAKTGADATSSAATTTVTKDTVAPTFSAITMSSNNSSTTIAKVDNIVTLHATSSETISTPTITIFGRSATVTNSGNAWTGTSTASSTDATGTVAFSINGGYTDNAGNSGATTTSLTSGAGVFMYQPPVITILGSNPVSSRRGLGYSDAGATALDSRGTNITSSIVTTSNVNTNSVGTYTVTYAVSDAVGSATTTATRTVNIVSGGGSSYGNIYGNTGTTSTTTVTTISTSTNSLLMVTPSGNVIQVPITKGTLNAQAVHNAIVIKRQLKFGLRGDDISWVQSVLAKDSSIYPEGFVTGFFGKLTQKAVQRFQEKYGIASQGNGGYGQIGPKTKAKLMELFGGM